MRCRVCDYALWNLRTRQCPECGEGFHPSDYRFIENSVKFCCPHCEQVYYGTDEQGHLSPRAFTCAGCEINISMDEMVLLPADGVKDWETEPEQVPWQDARGMGHVGAWFATVGRSLFSPHRLLTTRPGINATGQAWSFAAVTSLMVTLGVILPYLLIIGVVMGFVGFGGRPGVFAGGGLIVLGTVAIFILAFVLVTLLYIVVWGLAAHLTLKVSGPVESSIGRTYQAICYSSGANVTTTVPCIGSYFGWIWWIVSAVFMLKTAQRVSAFRAIAAAAVFPIIIVVLTVTAYVMIFFSAANFAGGFQPGQFGSVSAPAAARQVVGAVQAYARNHGSVPDHAASLVTDGHSDPLIFVVMESATMPWQVRVGTSSLQQLGALPYQQQLDQVDAATDDLPPNVVAHRLGDFVFCWHGLDLTTSDGELWLFIISADPIAQAATDMNGFRHVGLVNGTTRSIANERWEGALAEQNFLRVSAGLTPLPHPDRVRHDSPFVAPP